MFFKGDKKEIIIKGMKCEHCKEKVINTLEKIDNVEKIKIELNSGKTIIYYKNSLDMDTISKEINKLGYEIIND